MPTLLVVGGGLFGSLAAAHARMKGIEALVFDAGLDGAASPAAAGLFKEEWAGRQLAEHYHRALPVLERLYDIGHVTLSHDNGRPEVFLFVPLGQILEAAPVRTQVTAVGDGWLEAGGRRYEGWVYVAAGVWSDRFLPTLSIRARAGAAFLFPGERAGRIRPVARGRQAIAFVRDPGTTYFSDGTAEPEYTEDHDRATRARAAALGLTEEPVRRLWGRRPYTPGGPFFQQLGTRTWLGTGGRKLGILLGASCACRLVEELR